jgi:purine nucleosidase
MAQPLMTAEFVHGQDGLGDAGVPASTRRPASTLAAAEIVQLARSRPGELTLVAVGPLTNIGLALLLEPELPRLIKNVVVMGGAIGVPGNASELGEANIWHDPEAAQLVVDAPWDLVLVGLEITMSTQLPQAALKRIETSADPRAQFMWPVMQQYLDVYEANLGERSCVLHDPLAMALALDPGLATYRLVRASIELRGERSRGQVVADLRGYQPAPTDPAEPGVVRIVDSLDITAFHERFLRALGA